MLTSLYLRQKSFKFCIFPARFKSLKGFCLFLVSSCYRIVGVNKLCRRLVNVYIILVWHWIQFPIQVIGQQAHFLSSKITSKVHSLADIVEQLEGVTEIKGENLQIKKTDDHWLWITSFFC